MSPIGMVNADIQIMGKEDGIRKNSFAKSKIRKRVVEMKMKKAEEMERNGKHKTKKQQAAKTAYADLPGEQL